MRELTTTELGAVSGGITKSEPIHTSGINIGNLNGNSLLNAQSQAGFGNGIGNSNIPVQNNNNSISLNLGGGLAVARQY